MNQLDKRYLNPAPFSKDAGSLDTTLPDAALALSSGIDVIVFNIAPTGSSSVVVRAAGSQLIDSLPTKSITAGNSALFVSNGTNWYSLPSGTGVGASGYTTIQDEGAPLPQRTTINFTGGGVTATETAGITEVSIPAGASGPTGVQGPPGFTGADGDDGALGPPGNQGPTGAAGADGAPGVRGPQGDDGDDGFPGPPGAAGVAGPAGADGASGSRGTPGDDGDDGQPGVPGLLGATGAQGFMGPIGYPGDDGDEGRPGNPGPPGITGVTTVEVNLGATPVTQGSFTITDSFISTGSKILLWQAPGPYTGKGTRADEAEMDEFPKLTVLPGAGTATVKWSSKLAVIPVYMDVGGNGNIFGISSVAISQDTPRRIIGSQVLGRAKGNVKFNYLVL